MPTQEKDIGDVFGETLQSTGRELLPFLMTQASLKRQAAADEFGRRIDLAEFGIKSAKAKRDAKAFEFDFGEAQKLAPLILKEKQQGLELTTSEQEAKFFRENPDEFNEFMQAKISSKRGRKSVPSAADTLFKGKQAVTKQTRVDEAEAAKKLRRLNRGAEIAHSKKKAGLIKALQGDELNEALTELGPTFTPQSQADFEAQGERFPATDTAGILGDVFRSDQVAGGTGTVDDLLTGLSKDPGFEGFLKGPEPPQQPMTAKKWKRLSNDKKVQHVLSFFDKEQIRRMSESQPKQLQKLIENGLAELNQKFNPQTSRQKRQRFSRP